MKKNLTLAIIFLATMGVQAQQPDSLRAKISYSFKHIEDTTARDKPYTEQMVLLLGRNASLYTSMDRITSYRERMKALQEQLNTAAPGEPLKMTGPSKKLNSVDIFQFPNEKKMFIKRKLFNDYLIGEELPTISWKIEPDTMVISGLRCQKATTKFKGRDYTAWFCPELPFQAGPWKLNGLPGLILEAHDAKNEVEFKFESFEVVRNTGTPKAAETNTISAGGGTISFGSGSPEDVLNSVVIELPKKGIKTTQKEYDKLKQAMDRDPAGFINSMMAGAAGNVVMTVNPNMKPATPPKPVNNPIELIP